MNNGFNQFKDKKENGVLKKSDKDQKISTLISEVNALKVNSAKKRSEEKIKASIEIANLYEENYKLSATVEALSRSLNKRLCQNVTLKEENERYKNEKERLYFLLKYRVTQNDYPFKNTSSEIMTIVDRINCDVRNVCEFGLNSVEIALRNLKNLNIKTVLNRKESVSNLQETVSNLNEQVSPQEHLNPQKSDSNHRIVTKVEEKEIKLIECIVDNSKRKKQKWMMNKSLSRIPVPLSNASKGLRRREEKSESQALKKDFKIDQVSNINCRNKNSGRSLSVDRAVFSSSCQELKEMSAMKINERGSKIPVRKRKIDKIIKVEKKNSNRIKNVNLNPKTLIDFKLETLNAEEEENRKLEKSALEMKNSNHVKNEGLEKRNQEIELQEIEEENRKIEKEKIDDFKDPKDCFGEERLEDKVRDQLSESLLKRTKGSAQILKRFSKIIRGTDPTISEESITKIRLENQGKNVERESQTTTVRGSSFSEENFISKFRSGKRRKNHKKQQISERRECSSKITKLNIETIRTVVDLLLKSEINQRKKLIIVEGKKKLMKICEESDKNGRMEYFNDEIVPAFEGKSTNSEGDSEMTSKSRDELQYHYDRQDNINYNPYDRQDDNYNHYDHQDDHYNHHQNNHHHQDDHYNHYHHQDDNYNHYDHYNHHGRHNHQDHHHNHFDHPYNNDDHHNHHLPNKIVQKENNFRGSLKENSQVEMKSRLNSIFPESQGNFETFEMLSGNCSLFNSRNMNRASWISQVGTRSRQSNGGKEEMQEQHQQLSNKMSRTKETKNKINQIENCVGNSSLVNKLRSEEFIRGIEQEQQQQKQQSSESSERRVSDCKAHLEDFDSRKFTQMSNDSGTWENL
ncbi:putative leucine-rich repeat-containing protein DDB_G0290503 [Leptopilina heterotoma]|uniref:putative leucine-rich repeat-containing protein DDB_G0290503 n=1 Tax=Leptopilina heterotoma TaxID=63436 RepID=UPI001CA8CB16|nr:putative leucine-rich repeat-containing protein DDB_G0290503 [Leptopilina heterotoma]